MKNISNYPWYLQHSERFNIIYNGMFEWLNNASSLDIENAYNVDFLTGKGLANFGALWGLTSTWGGTSDGLIYDLDNWSEDKVWTGRMNDPKLHMYRNFIKMKAYIVGRPYTLGLLKKALEIVTAGEDAEFWIEEGYMNFVIHIKASAEVLNMFYNMTIYDPYFLGKPTGISYTWDYTQKTE